MVIPQRGGQERVLGESNLTGSLGTDEPYLAWTPDSKGLVFPSAEGDMPPCGLFLLNIETREKQKLTTLPMDRLGDTAPALSPDGRTPAFRRLRNLAVRQQRIEFYATDFF